MQLKLCNGQYTCGVGLVTIDFEQTETDGDVDMYWLSH